MTNNRNDHTNNTDRDSQGRFTEEHSNKRSASGNQGSDSSKSASHKGGSNASNNPGNFKNDHEKAVRAGEQSHKNQNRNDR